VSSLRLLLTSQPMLSASLYSWRKFTLLICCIERFYLDISIISKTVPINCSGIEMILLHKLSHHSLQETSKLHLLDSMILSELYLYF
jgi:hypothetical protein